VRIPDSNNQLADFNRLRITERCGDEISSRNPNDGEIRVGIIADFVRLEALPVGQSDFDVLCSVNNMAVGENETVWSENKSRTGPTPPFLMTHFNVDDRGTNLLCNSNNSFRISIK